MNTRFTVPVVLCALMLGGASALAQPVSSWNRRVEAVSVTPDPTRGTHSIHVPVELLVRNGGEVLNLSTEVEARVNGVVVGPLVAWSVRSGDPTASCSLDCGSDCGPLLVDGVLNTMICHENDPLDCECGHWLTADFPGVPISPGDEIMVILYPAPGALPDGDTSDDVFVLTFAGDPVGWNRRVAGIGIEPSPVAAFFDVHATIDLHAAGTTSDLPLSTRVELMVNGTAIGSAVAWDVQLSGPSGDCEFSCGSGCGGLYVDGVFNTMTCHEDGPGDCDCGYWLTADFPGIELMPADEIMVLLRPAPGAIPDPDESDDTMMHVFGGRPVGWSREILAVDVVPSLAKDSFFDVWTEVSLDGSGFAAGLDLGTEVELRINGTPVGGLQGWSIQPTGPSLDCESSCGFDCGPLYVDGVLNTMLCRKDGPTDCDCGYWLVAGFPGVGLNPGDEIMVLLRPAPGAVPDADGSAAGDVLVTAFDGTTAGRNRSIDDAHLVETAPGVYDVAVGGSVAMAGVTGFRDVSFEVQLEVDGAVVAMQPMIMEYTPDTASPICQEDCSGGACGDFGTGGPSTIAAQCLVWPGFVGCSCGASWSAVFPATAIPPAVPVQVRLVPAPGALPELPGLMGDDERPVDRTTAVGDRPLPADGTLLAQNTPNPFNPRTEISFRTVTSGPVLLEIFDARGTLVRTLVNEVRDAGTWTVAWDGTDARGIRVASGHYFYRLSTDGASETRTMTLLK
jgi:hypothetical protein